ncbi:MAG: thiamine phosphate synthase [Myxococcales bacterium]|jgi:thiamine-phosphate pyrophosphorylase|nr:thiamine phosphate synthase [Myxococcales bacterium]
MRGLYAILDVTFARAKQVEELALARALLAAEPCALQLRAKDLSAREVLELLRRLRPLCQRAGVPLVANDRVDLAALAGCDMVHVGQEDLPHDLVSRIAPSVAVGVSTHDLAQLERALAARPRYVAYGPVFATTTKRNPDPVVGLDDLRTAADLARRARIPLVAIGGITLERAPEVGRLTPVAAVIGDVLAAGASESSITARARALGSALAGSSRMAEALS